MSREITIRTVWATEHTITVPDEFTPNGDPTQLPEELNPSSAVPISYTLG